VTFEDIASDLRAIMPELRGRLTANAALADITWFRVGGPAQVLFSPADEADLAYFLQTLPDGIPINVIGLGSNLLVRDGGVPGIVIRLGRGFGEINVEPGNKLTTGTAVPDVKVARAAAEAWGSSGRMRPASLPRRATSKGAWAIRAHASSWDPLRLWPLPQSAA